MNANRLRYFTAGCLTPAAGAGAMLYAPAGQAAPVAAAVSGLSSAETVFQDFDEATLLIKNASDDLAMGVQNDPIAAGAVVPGTPTSSASGTLTLADTGAATVGVQLEQGQQDNGHAPTLTLTRQ